MKDPRILTWIVLIGTLLMGGSCSWFAGASRSTLSMPKDVSVNSEPPKDEEHSPDLRATSSNPRVGDADSTRLRSRTEVDINSGDYRSNQYLADLSVKSTTFASQLSKEVRRLGLDTPASPTWKPAIQESHVPGDFDFSYARAVKVGEQLVGFFQMTQTSDDERRVILAEFMKSLRTQTPVCTMNHGYLLIERILCQHGLSIYDQYPSGFRSIRTKVRDAAELES